MLPDPSTVSPAGKLKRALLPVPSVLPLVPANPASVVTPPPAVILRIVSLLVSAT